MSSQTTPPGWYPHPRMAATLGYWDGERWTEQVAPMRGDAARTPEAEGPVDVPLLIVGYVLVVLMPIGAYVVAAVLWRRAQAHAIVMMVLGAISALSWYSYLAA